MSIAFYVFGGFAIAGMSLLVISLCVIAGRGSDAEDSLYEEILRKQQNG